MDDTNLALLTTPLQYWQEVAKELLKNNKNLDAVRYIIAQTGCDMLEAGQIRDQLRKRIMNEAVVVKSEAPTDDLARLQAENERLRDALKTVLRKANSLAGYYPEPGDEREAYGMDAPLVFDDIRKTARVALEGGE